MASQDDATESLMNTLTDVVKCLEDVHKMEFIEISGLFHCIESSLAMLEVVRQALKVKDSKFAIVPSLEKSLLFILNYLDGAKQTRTCLYEITGSTDVKPTLKKDPRLEEKIVAYIKAIPVYLGSLEIVKKSEAYVKTMMKRAREFAKRSEVGGGYKPKGENEGELDLSKFDMSGEMYGEKELKFFVNDLMNYLQVLKMQAEEKGLHKYTNIVDEMKKFEKNSRKVKLIGYYGERINDMKEGKGQYYYLNGDIYDGEWKYDKKHGYGVYTFLDKGSKYEGTWKEDKMDGKGVYYYKNGSKYDGEWVTDKREGNGIFHYENGSKYDGEWKNDQMHGKGIFVYHNGSKFMGEWKNDQIHGRGIFQFASGYQVEEEWRDGIKKKETIRQLV